MRTVELVDGIYSSALGFGCAPILGSVDAKQARRALDCALDCGITHFDLARSYGYGEAERFVGNVLKGRRSQVVLASKFGIEANWKAKMLRPAKPLLRFMRSSMKEKSSPNPITTQTGIPTMADRLLDRPPLRGVEMQKSLERSLRALKTDYLDYFFVHEPIECLANFEELASTAERLKTEGKIRAWGIAYMRAQESIHQPYLTSFDVLQFDNSPGTLGYNSLVKERGSLPNIFFSPFRKGTLEMKPTEKLHLLRTDFPNSVILCSMFNTKHLRENADAVK